MGEHVDYFVVCHPNFLKEMLQEPCKWQCFLMLSYCWKYPHPQPTSDFVLACVQVWTHLAIQKFCMCHQTASQTSPPVFQAADTLLLQG